MRPMIKTFILCLFLFLNFLPDGITKPKEIYRANDYIYTWDRSEKTLRALSENIYKEVASFEVTGLPDPSSYLRKKHLTVVEPDSDLSKSAFPNKIFDREDKLYIAINVKANVSHYLYLIEFDKATEQFSKRRIPLPRPSDNVIATAGYIYNSVNSYIFDRYLFQVYVQNELFLMEIKLLDNPDKILKNYSFTSKEPISFSNTPVLKHKDGDYIFLTNSGTRTYKQKDAIKASSKFIRKAVNRNIGIVAEYSTEDVIELTIGSYKIQTSVYQDNMFGPGAPGGFGSAGSVEETLYFKSFLQAPDFNHVDNETLQELGVNSKK